MNEREAFAGLRTLAIVEIWWFDSHASNTWHPYDDDPVPLYVGACKTVGYRISESEHYITITRSLGDDEVEGTMSIPRAAIVKIRRLR